MVLFLQFLFHGVGTHSRKNKNEISDWKQKKEKELKKGWLDTKKKKSSYKKMLQIFKMFQSTSTGEKKNISPLKNKTSCG